MIYFDTAYILECYVQEWPVEHVVKVYCEYHPDDSAHMKASQEDTIVRLAHAARANGLEFLLEVLASPVAPVDEHTTAEVIQRFYDIGVRAGLVEAGAHGERCRLVQDLRSGRAQRSLQSTKAGIAAPEARARRRCRIFYIGAHAETEGLTLLTRDIGRYRSCFPSLKLVRPRESFSRQLLAMAREVVEHHGSRGAGKRIAELRRSGMKIIPCGSAVHRGLRYRPNATDTRDVIRP